MIIDIEGHEKAGKTTLRKELSRLLSWVVSYTGFRPIDIGVVRDWTKYVIHEHLVLNRMREMNPGVLIITDRLIYDLVKLEMEDGCSNITNRNKIRQMIVPDIIILADTTFKTVRSRGNRYDNNFLTNELNAILKLPTILKKYNLEKDRPILVPINCEIEHDLNSKNNLSLACAVKIITDAQYREFNQQTHKKTFSSDIK